jgi:hypothetical protein
MRFILQILFLSLASSASLTLASAELCQKFLQSTMPFSASERAPAPTQAETWNFLRENDLLIGQRAVPQRDDLCGPACALNILQVGAVQSGATPLSRKQAESTLHELAKLYHDGTDMTKMNVAIKSLFKTYLKPGFTVSGQALKSLTFDRTDSSITATETFDLTDLTPKIGEQKIVLCDLFDLQGNERALHWLAIEKVSGTKVTFVDPEAPYITTEAELSVPAPILGIVVPSYRLLKGAFANIGWYIPIGIITIKFEPNH